MASLSKCCKRKSKCWEEDIQILTRENPNVDKGLKSKPGMPGISGDAASPGICHIPFILRTMNELLHTNIITTVNYQKIVNMFG